LRADEKISAGWKRIDAFEDGIRVCAREAEMERTLARRDIHSGVRKIYGKPWPLPHITHFTIHLAAILHEEQRHLAISSDCGLHKAS